MSVRDAATAYVGAFVDELAECGVHRAVISPGSRSTPMAMVLAAHPGIRVWMNVDERSAGFFALGMAKATGEPVALLCTSGTAAANYFPAVAEAHLSRVPLVVLTADRPHELRDVGAPQAMDQLRLYGSHVKWFAEMALPEKEETMLRYARTNAGRAAATAKAGPPGPVHLNFPFREPLVPDLNDSALFSGGKRKGRPSPYVRVAQGEKELPESELAALAAEWSRVERGLIVCGPQTDPELVKPLIRLAEALQFPLLADPLSQLRCGDFDKARVVDGYDAFLRDADAVEKLVPEVVIRFGAMPVSKAFLLYLKAHPDCRQIVVDADEGWRDPTLSASEMLYADPVRFCKGLIRHMKNHRIKGETLWSRRWLQINHRTQEVVRRWGDTRSLSEGGVFLELAGLLPRESLLFAGNSMPVRDLETFFMKGDRPVRTMANRGVNGIDGVVSTALGTAAAGCHTVLVLGDLSFYHDLNGLLAAKMHRIHATIIVINNDGGGIFSFLPQASEAEHFEKLFGTPIGLDFSHAVRMYGGTFDRVGDWDAFRDALRRGENREGLSVIEVVTNRRENASLHRRIWQAVSEAVAEELSKGE
ncbi:2-succinyl-5-enolpyruvyl-6-hydroxy-3-cyclohexene-1-carboxylic-acid synthase [Paludifilum halophilum]|uniref:2-succinyl-5-enolpyruvyl-6-hydroxy-3-cyclohexene-1-carboxylate synthase n=1 Tax=Paludifilum halophilum TaxID=1642702 RepID=A0A235B676_9BACL|nr:2-succinyl-5-enolpyruvyl-6-hydroxy-3-cyclohexene-1-carboxylic-acid synthase [Paludifilum halophilum]OYD07095.1 2-succinyl-5-enolpyruvyl-6-hydroxy-3-cyclohexene-1-carboxylic-acid synthase [Paludifilum halophilum]